jgi:predicted nucleic-acid-binding protein
MKRALADTNIIVRFLTGDPPDMAERVRALFQAVDRGELSLIIPEIVIAESIWMLHSYYEISRSEIARILVALIAQDGLDIDDRPQLIEALRLFSEMNVDFADALLAVKMRQEGVSEIYSFDHHFDRIPGLIRLTPG